MSVSALQALISTILAIVGTALAVIQCRDGQIKQDLEEKNQEFKVVNDLLGKCSSPRLEDIRFATVFVKALDTQQSGKDAISYQFTANPSFQGALHLCYQMLAVSTQAEPAPASRSKVVAPTSSAAPASATPASAANWIYLGTYKGGKWETRYLDFQDSFDPTKDASDKETKDGPVFSVSRATGALNMRTGDFGPAGEFPPVDRAIPPGGKIQIKRTWQWFNSGNWWAVIDPS